jgi:hypothetical protein
MDVSKLIELRKEAEKAVAGMPEGDLKVKAFEVILNHILGGKVAQQPASYEEGKVTKKSKVSYEKEGGGISGRLLVLKEEDFFRAPKSIAQVREALAARGWHYPRTTISPTLLNLVRKKQLRRQKSASGWAYTNY